LKTQQPTQNRDGRSTKSSQTRFDLSLYQKSIWNKRVIWHCSQFRLVSGITF